MHVDDFYFKYIDIDNLEDILEETRSYVLKKVEEIPNPGFALLNNTDEFIENCPLIVSWVKNQGLELSKVAVHILEPNTEGFLHSDFYSDVSKLALNLDMSNCSGTETKMFRVDSPGKKITTLNGALSYTVYDFDKSVCAEVGSFDLKTPTLFNISKPHKVYNLKDSKRISLSLRFVLHPLHLIYS